MYLLDIRLSSFKLFADFSLSFRDAEGQPRMFTAIIAENAGGKTALLQAIALAAAGHTDANSLALPVVGGLRDCRPPARDRDLQIEARFGFAEPAYVFTEETFGFTPLSGVELRARLRQPPDEPTRLRGEAELLTPDGDPLKRLDGDPLESARAKRRPRWFVAAYGVGRALPDAGQKPTIDNPSYARMASLFPGGRLASTTLANAFAERSEDEARSYAAILKRALTATQELLPRIRDFELRGQGGAKSAQDITDRPRWTQSAGPHDLKLTAAMLSHGYQSTIAWIADLVGFLLLEAGADTTPEDFCGLVLLDELDLYLHPTWQAVIVPALRRTFPRIQFIVTTHTPVLLASLAPDEIVRLDSDPATGDIRRTERRDDARLMTGSEILERYFGLADIHPSPLGQALCEYQLLAANPYRSDDDERRMQELAAQLRSGKVTITYPVVARRGS